MNKELLELFDDETLREHYELDYMGLRKAKVELGVEVPVALEYVIKVDLQIAYDNAELDLEDAEDLADKLATTPARIQAAMLGNFEPDNVDRDKAIREDLKTMPASEVAHKYGLSLARVSQLNPNAISRKRKVKLTKEQWQELLSQYPRFTITELAQMYKVSRAAIYRRLDK